PVPGEEWASITEMDRTQARRAPAMSRSEGGRSGLAVRDLHAEMRHVGAAETVERHRLAVDAHLRAADVADAHVQRLVAVPGLAGAGGQQAVFHARAVLPGHLDPTGSRQAQAEAVGAAAGIDGGG